MKTHQTLKQAGKSRILFTCVFALVLLSTLGFNGCPPPDPPPPSAPNPDTLCFPPSRGVPDFPNPPTIDGVIGGVPGDLGWSFASRYVFNNGTSVPDGIVQLLRSDAGNALYLSFEVNNDKTFDDKDAILLVFSPGGGAANDRRIIIFPNDTGITKAANSAPRLVRYWNNSATWNNVGVASADGAAWLVNNIKVSGQSDGPTSQHWYVEMKIPITNVAAAADPNADTGINIPANAQFGFHFNTIRTENNNGNLTAMQFPWPTDAPLTGLASKPQENTPLAADWGSGVRNSGSACNGVFFDWYDIKIDHAGAPNINESQIALNNASNVQNKFTVSPHNDTVNSGGTYIAANGVQATFKIRNYGLGNQYEIVGASDGNPVAPNPTNAISIPASNPPALGTATTSTNNWKLNPAQQTKYSNSGDQCILVELSAAGAANSTTVFKNKSAFRNMYFVATNSPFKGEARLVTRGYKVEQVNGTLEFYLNAYNYYTNSKEKWETKIEGVEDLGNGQYRVKTRPDTEVRLPATITPPPITLPNAKTLVLPGTGGAGHDIVAIPVKPGELITVLAEGGLQVRSETANETGNEAGPNGIFIAKDSDGGKFPLPPQFQPGHHIGALIGSWDKFKEKTFLLGSENTFKVPKGVDTLFLGLNDTAEGYKQHKGRGFQVELVATPLEQVYTYGNSLVSRDPTAEQFSFPVAVNLPTWALCGQRVTGKTITIEGQVYKEVESAGCYAYAVKSIGTAH